MYVERLVLNDFRAIASSDIVFIHPMSPRASQRELPNINLLVGTNGGGKSTILKGIAAAAMGDRVDLGFLTGESIQSWPRLGATGKCYARLTHRTTGNGPPALPGDELGTVSESMLTIEPGRITSTRPDGSESGISVEVYLFGYGPQRQTAAGLDPGTALDPTGLVANLFEQSQQLFAPEPWLPDIDEAALGAINVLMPPDVQITGAMVDDQLEVENRGLRVPRGMLSDGAQSYIAWMLDLIFRLMRAGRGEDFQGVRGTVLVDEVDQRMHPRWQQVVLQQLADGLPRLQFVCTAHSPLLAGSLRPENLTVLEPDFNAPGEGAMMASQFAEDIYGRTADGVLTSSYFNLSSSRSAEFQHDLRRLSDAAADTDQAAIDFIRTLAAGSSEEDIHIRSELIKRPERFRRRRE